ncbi:MAG: exodeoxyribonuclease VII small subunit [Candidatus Saccharimonadales bacterium]
MAANKSSKNMSYRQMSHELARIMEWFEAGDVDLDQALVKYEEAIQILGQMEIYLKTAENKIKKITARLGV